MAIKRRIQGFTGIDLNDSNVQGLFNECLPTSETQEYVKSVLLLKDMYSKGSKGIFFDNKRLLNNLGKIRYLFGQLIAVHNNADTITLDPHSKYRVTEKYDGSYWNDDKRYSNATILFRNS